MSGVHKEKLSNLAEHHYLVTFIGWRLAKALKDQGANIDIQKVLEFCLIHDMGELLGGDISALYAPLNKRAKKFAKAFEEENQKFMSKFFDGDSSYIRKITKEILDAKSDEALIAKTADYMECAHYKVYVQHLTLQDAELSEAKIKSYIKRMKDKTAKKILSEFLPVWLKNLENNNYIAILKNG
jgi:5'-deoxynucleotidase YfbR-like HD superfamily hydrolase